MLLTMNTYMYTTGGGIHILSKYKSHLQTTTIPKHLTKFRKLGWMVSYIILCSAADNCIHTHIELLSDNSLVITSSRPTLRIYIK